MERGCETIFGQFCRYSLSCYYFCQCICDIMHQTCDEVDHMTCDEVQHRWTHSIHLAGQDWRMLAQHMNFHILEIENMKLIPNPTGEVLKRAVTINATVGRLLEILSEMERIDVLEDCKTMIGEVILFQACQFFQCQPTKQPKCSSTQHLSRDCKLVWPWNHFVYRFG